jgi:hypothetical protein
MVNYNFPGENPEILLFPVEKTGQATTNDNLLILKGEVQRI